MESTGKENTPIISTHKINPKVLIIFTYETWTPTLGPHSCIIHVEVWDFRKAAPWQVVESFRTDLKCKLRTLLILKCFTILRLCIYIIYKTFSYQNYVFKEFPFCVLMQFLITCASWLQLSSTIGLMHFLILRPLCSVFKIIVHYGDFAQAKTEH